ncbi:hypothetical protein SAMN06295912_103218 [Sphingomonas laterariae]|uniref:Lysophospholipase, alpha-beta hydrolase superfamily n=1 Tax=Edaphosphingomonas laterariae TaxID=861865 RepID=A0A239D6A1_9SPHN|nr:hypothetical protein [Sphingomonas laterariae]SNS27384.1 hypothetical protein SAMN06295912_103218 [Sphingomonas laterariae]
MSVETLRLDVGALVDGGEPITLALDVHVPAVLASRPLLFWCVPGGGVSRNYYDLGDPAGEGGDFSFAAAMVAAGHIVATIDPAGVGESTRPADGYALTTEIVAEANIRALAELRRRIAAGKVAGLPALADLPTIGTGHSAGAMIGVVHQAARRDFHAMLLFCFGTVGLPEYLDDDIRAALETPDGGRSRVVEFARARFGDQPYLPAPVHDKDTPSGRALRQVMDRVLANVGTHAMMPGNVVRELGQLDVPVFLSVGDRDMTGPPHLMPRDYGNCPDFTLYVVRTSGHHVFVAPGADRLYGRILGWVDGLTVD